MLKRVSDSSAKRALDLTLNHLIFFQLTKKKHLNNARYGVLLRVENCADRSLFSGLCGYVRTNWLCAISSIDKNSISNTFFRCLGLGDIFHPVLEDVLLIKKLAASATRLWPRFMLLDNGWSDISSLGRKQRKVVGLAGRQPRLS